MTYIVHAQDTEGAVTFNLTYQDATSNVGLVETEADITDQTRVLVDHTAPTLQVVRIVSSNLGKSRIAAISPKVDLPVANTGEPWNPGTNTATQGNVVALTIQASEFIYQPVVTFLSGGRLVKANVAYINTDCGSQTIDDSGSVVVSNAGINITSNLTFTNNDMGEPMPDSISYTDNHCGASSAPDSLTWVMTYRVSSVSYTHLTLPTKA